MQSESKVSTGHLTVIPKDVRRAVGIEVGDQLTWTVRGGSILVTCRRRKKLADLIGVVSHGGDAVDAKRRAQRGARGVR